MINTSHVQTTPRTGNCSRSTRIEVCQLHLRACGRGSGRASGRRHHLGNQGRAGVSRIEGEARGKGVDIGLSCLLPAGGTWRKEQTT